MKRHVGITSILTNALHSIIIHLSGNLVESNYLDVSTRCVHCTLLSTRFYKSTWTIIISSDRTLLSQFHVLIFNAAIGCIYKSAISYIRTTRLNSIELYCLCLTFRARRRLKHISICPRFKSQFLDIVIRLVTVRAIELFLESKNEEHEIFSCISQDEKMWDETVHLKSSMNSISCYKVTLEKGTRYPSNFRGEFYKK